MAIDKLVDSTQLDADLTSVANAIRTKGGTSAQLAFPNGFISAIQNLGGDGLTNEVKQALLQIGQKVAYIDDQGQQYYNELMAALYPVDSITAVFTQGSAVIYDTDSLDTLKQYLVVTANYSDGSSETVTNYTLSGTLTAGTSTITVTYGNKTDIFSVTVHAGLPSEYTKYDYLKYTGNVTKQESSNVWIALKKYDNLNALSLEFALKPQDNNPGASILGRRSASGATSSFGFYSKRTTLGWHLHGSDSTAEPTLVTNAINVVKYTNTSASPSSLQTNDNAPVSVVWANNNVLNLALVMFANPVNDANANLSDDAEIGYLKFSNLNGEIVGHYIPVVRTADNRIGMFDLIEQVFYTSTTASYTTIGNSSCKYAAGDWS